MYMLACVIGVRPHFGESVQFKASGAGVFNYFNPSRLGRHARKFQFQLPTGEVRVGWPLTWAGQTGENRSQDRSSWSIRSPVAGMIEARQSC